MKSIAAGPHSQEHYLPETKTNVVHVCSVLTRRGLV